MSTKKIGHIIIIIVGYILPAALLLLHWNSITEMWGSYLDYMVVIVPTATSIYLGGKWVDKKIS